MTGTMRYLVSLGMVAVMGVLGYSIGEFFGGEMGMKVGTLAGVIFGALIMAALNVKVL